MGSGGAGAAFQKARDLFKKPSGVAKVENFQGGSDMSMVIGIDLGGTKILAGAVTPGGEVLHVQRELTGAQEGSEAVVGRIVGMVERIRAQLSPGDGPPLAITVGVPGGVDIVNGVVDKAPN